MKNNKKNIDQTIVLLILDKIESVKKLATDPISIATASAKANQLGLPSSKRSIKCNVEMIDDKIGTATKQETIALLRNLLFSTLTYPAIF